jgi:hypothetical protein
MARTYRATYPGTDYHPAWGKPGRGKYYKRAYNRAVRRVANGTGKTRAVARWASELNYKGT